MMARLRAWLGGNWPMPRWIVLTLGVVYVLPGFARSAHVLVEWWT